MNAKDKRLAAARVIRLAVTSGEYGNARFMCPALDQMVLAGTISVADEEAGLLYVHKLMNVVYKSSVPTLNSRLRSAYACTIPAGSTHPELYLRYADWLEFGGYLTKAEVKAICCRML